MGQWLTILQYNIIGPYGLETEYNGGVAVRLPVREPDLLDVPGGGHRGPAYVQAFLLPPPVCAYRNGCTIEKDSRLILPVTFEVNQD